MSYTEIINWGALVLALIIGGAYTAIVWGADSVEQITGALVVATITMVVVVVVFAIAVAIPMAIRSDGTLEDRRDAIIGLGATPYGFAVAMLGCAIAAGDIILRSLQGQPFDPVVTLNLIVATMFFSVVTGTVVTLIRYRTGVR